MNKQYTCPGKFEDDVEISVCHRGMHFCRNALDCFNYYSFNPDNHIAEVIAYGNVVECGDKCRTDKLEIVREIPWQELLEIVNTGKVLSQLFQILIRKFLKRLRGLMLNVNNNNVKEVNIMECDYIECGDCLELMKDIPDKSIDMILCDLPYGTTACKWDNVIPFESLWEQYKRIIKDNGAIVLFGSEPFSSELRLSNLKWFKYDWIWEKNRGTGFLNAKKMPLKNHETISVFYKHLPTYNPQMRTGFSSYEVKQGKQSGAFGGVTDKTITTKNNGDRYPLTVLKYDNLNGRNLHPTQKPVALLEYLINTYTNEGETVLDNCMGSGSTCVACVNTNRHYIGFELDPQYYDIACKRLEEQGIVPTNRNFR